MHIRCITQYTYRKRFIGWTDKALHAGKRCRINLHLKQQIGCNTQLSPIYMKESMSEGFVHCGCVLSSFAFLNNRNRLSFWIVSKSTELCYPLHELVVDLSLTHRACSTVL